HYNKDGYLLNKDRYTRQFELAQSSLFAAVELIYRQIEQLQQQMATIQKAITDLSQSIPSSLQPSIEEVSKKTALKAGFNADPNDRLRKMQGFLRNLQSEKGDSESIKEISDKIGATAPSKFFRLSGKDGIRPLILEKKDNADLSSLVARPNYSPDEEKKYKEAWKEACTKNDAAGRKEFVVRNLKVVKLERPEDWKKMERPTRA
ncbi:hypothetical protein PFISCL1PPCAC_5201, partial [Pristionchus fissidentatus]